MPFLIVTLSLLLFPAHFSRLFLLLISIDSVGKALVGCRKDDAVAKVNYIFIHFLHYQFSLFIPIMCTLMCSIS